MTIGSENLPESLLWLGVYVLIAAAFAGVVVWIARRRGSRTIVLDAAQAVARLTLLLATAVLVATVWRWVTERETTIWDLPVTMDWPTSLPGAAGGTGAQLVWANIDTARATVSGLSAAPRILLASSELLTILLFAAPAVVVAVLCRQALRGEPFAPAASRWLFGSAIVVLVAGSTIDLLGSIGRTLAAAEVLPGIDSGAAAVSQGLFMLTVPVWPIGAALALATLGVIFRHGAALERDTAGLV